MGEVANFGTRLRSWRERRGISQLELAGRAETSQRHLSFLESGRSQPSRDIVVRLVSALDLSLRQQNALLLAAGYAPIWQESGLEANEMNEVNTALDFMLSKQEPYPAVVVDRRWNVLRANNGAVRLVEFASNPTDAQALSPPNLADALVAPNGMRCYLLNWPEVVSYFIRLVQSDATADGTPETAELCARLMAYPDVPKAPVNAAA